MSKLADPTGRKPHVYVREVRSLCDCGQKATVIRNGEMICERCDRLDHGRNGHMKIRTNVIKTTCGNGPTQPHIYKTAR